MSGGGGTKSSSSSTSYSGSGQKWAQPIASRAAGDVNSVYHAAQPGLQQLTNTVQHDLVPALTDQFHYGQPVAKQGIDYYGDVLSGKYLNGNPYLDKILNASNTDLADQLAQKFSMNGRYGSDAMSGSVARAILNNESNLRYNDYNNQMGRMDSAAGAAQQSNLANYAQAITGIGAGAQIPYTGTSNLASSLGALFNGGTSTSTSTSKTEGPSLFAMLLGSAAQAGGAAAAACDERLKQNVTLNHIEPDGLAFYDFDYKPGLGLPEGRQTNLPMAQDVATFRPWALGPEYDGFMTIYPEKL